MDLDELPPIVCEYADVFPEDLPGLPPIRDIEFEIDLAPGHDAYFLKFLGHVVSGDGIAIDSLKIEAVMDWQTPKNVFKLKTRLTTSPVLVIPTRELGYAVYCDASHNGLGCFLMQEGKVVTYASCQLKPHKKNYPTHNLELAATVFALKSWRHYLYREKFEVFSEHKSLKYIFTQRDLNLRYRECITNLVMHFHKSLKYLYREKFECYVIHLGHPIDTFEPSTRGTTAERGGRFLSHSAPKRRKDVKAEHQRLVGLLQPLEIPEWKWEHITMDFVTALPRSQCQHDAVWVIVDRLMKSAHFLPIRMTDSINVLGRLYVREIVKLYRVPISIVSDRDPRFVLRFWQSLQAAIGTQLLLSTAFHPQTDGQSKHTILDFGGHVTRLCHGFQRQLGRSPSVSGIRLQQQSPLCWTEIGEASVFGPDVVQETTKKIKVIKKRLITTQNRQKCYANRRRRPLSFSVGDHVFSQDLTSSRFDAFWEEWEAITAFHWTVLDFGQGWKYNRDPSHVLDWTELALEQDASYEKTTDSDFGIERPRPTGQYDHYGKGTLETPWH
ncbi:hypothetical protein Acr_27g0002910 [Actinidia rufa]|uniref:Integrase catalytic domain-containing protein n=1 Tax=Actinidia rufa TaxID=165716 RepID=A0A7J0H649_9ERIC|nr:hypothetical protein Acr_27g0002910 [Actinidia rufa]